MGLPDRLTARLSMAEQHELLRARRASRRRAGAAVRATGSGTPGPTLVPSGTAVPGHLVVPFGRHLAFGPDPRTQLSVGWQVPARVRRPFLRYGDAPWSLGQVVPAEVRALHSALPGAIAPVTQYYLHARLAGLACGTTYYYAVGHDGADPAVPGRVDALRTAPSRRRPAAPFTFTAFGDQGVSPQALVTDRVIAGQRPVFHLHAGDIAYADSGGQGPGSYHPGAWDRFLAQTEPVAASVPWMVTMGNHDMEALYSPDGYGGQVARFDFPGNGPAHCPSVYSFIYGNVGVVSLDANDVSYEIPANLGYSGGTQTGWLRQRLAHLRAQPDVDFVVVFFHHCAYSTTSRHTSEGGVRDAWVPLFDDYQVDLVVNGHNHSYERTDALTGGVPTYTPVGATVYPDRDGTTYITAGAAGHSLYPFPVPDSYAGNLHDPATVGSCVWVGGRHRVPETVPWSRVRYTGYSFLAVDAVPAPAGQRVWLTVRALTDTGREIDRVVITRRAGAAGRRDLLRDPV